MLEILLLLCKKGVMETQLIGMWRSCDQWCQPGHRRAKSKHAAVAVYIWIKYQVDSIHIYDLTSGAKLYKWQRVSELCK